MRAVTVIIFLTSVKLIKPRALTSHKQFSFSHRVINNWNELPDSVVLSDNLNMFKGNFYLFWKDKDFKYEEKYIKKKTMLNVDNNNYYT